MNEERSPQLPRIKTRLPFSERPSTPGAAALQRASLAIYAVLAIGLSGLAIYNATIADHALTSPYVVAPAIGAAWFGLRLFMSLAPRS